MASGGLKTLRAAPLSARAYAPYGRVVAAGTGPAKGANMGTARRFDRLAALENLRPGATPNLCVFRCSPFRRRLFEVRLLEKHPFSTQAFLPMSAPARFLVVVALGGARPDLSTLAAFVAREGRGVTYRPGVWHHPMVALKRPIDFACIVHEDGTDGDCVVARLDAALAVRL